eukprot:988493-Amphidinium_carterae.1
MAWNNTKGVQQLIHSFEVMKALGIRLPLGRRGPRGSQPQQTPVTPGSKRWSAQQRAGCNCPKCTYYNFAIQA